MPFMPNEDHRPDPDTLLAALRAEEAHQRRGKLKIFLGMCAGVGKTYAMLLDARQRRQEGVEILAAVVETHHRAETDALLETIPVLPLKNIEYRGVMLHELDLDEALRRQPQLVLVDELAHSNAPGSRHPKRFQDVLELLDAGLNVYTTLNIQHVESRVDAVSAIAGIRVSETVPDSLLDRADEIQLIDLPPEQLRERLAEGKVYVGEQAATAADNFFRPENLTALREIALRLTAEHVGLSLREVMESRQIGGPWKTNERPMVAVGTSPFSEKLIRWTRRIAAALDTPWVAVYVETPRPLSDQAKTLLEKNLFLARQLGAEVVMTSGEDIAAALLHVAREHNVTQIVIGKTFENLLRRIFSGGSLVSRLIKHSGDIDIYIVRSEKSPARLARKLEPETVRHWVREFTLGTLAVAAVTLISWLMQAVVGYWAIALIYLGLVVFLATRFRRATILWAATASALAWDFLFIPPSFTFRIDRVHDLLMFIMFYVIALVIGHGTARLRLRELAERRREERAEALYRLTESVVQSTTLEESLRRAVAEIERLFQGRAIVLLGDEAGRLAPPFGESVLPMSEKEMSVAAWTFLNSRPAGRFTDTLPESESLYLPLRTANSHSGVLIIQLPGRKTLGLDEHDLLAAFADQIAAVVERFRLMQQASRTALAEESERLYRTLFDSVSHELKTPLAVISASTDELRRQILPSGDEPKLSLLEEIRLATLRLRRTIDNLLGMTRMESGRMKLELDWYEVAEVVQAAREQVTDVLAKYKVRGSLAPDLPLVKLDFGLMVHAVSNLLTNAAQNSPEGTIIHISANVDEDQLVLRVADQGSGLPGGETQRIFDKFFRGPNARPGGLGLGLSIVRGLIKAHGGEVTAENNPGGGAMFIIRLPVATTKLEAGTNLS
jgi:two-component system, OmpR family, sensor histidine kinase KdpD